MYLLQFPFSFVPVHYTLFYYHFIMKFSHNLCRKFFFFLLRTWRTMWELSLSYSSTSTGACSNSSFPRENFPIFPFSEQIFGEGKHYVAVYEWTISILKKHNSNVYNVSNLWMKISAILTSRGEKRVSEKNIWWRNCKKRGENKKVFAVILVQKQKNKF